MHVKVAGLDDLHRLSVFFLEAWSEAGPGALGFTGASDDTIHELASERTLEAKLTSPTLRIFVAVEDGGRILGFASVKKIDSALTELSGIIVLASQAGKGIGTELFKKAKEFASAEGYTRVVVKTEVFNETAIAFYKKQGFVETTEIEEDVEGTGIKLMALERSLP